MSTSVRRRDHLPPGCRARRRARARLPTVDEQITRVLTRVRPLVGPIRTLTATGEVSAVLQVVRNFNAEDGEAYHDPPVVTDNGQVLKRLAGQHQLLGWHLAVEALSFLASIPADLDIDEYG